MPLVSALPRKCRLGSEGPSGKGELAVCSRSISSGHPPRPWRVWDPRPKVKALLLVRTQRGGRDPQPGFRLKYTFLRFRAGRPGGGRFRSRPAFLRQPTPNSHRRRCARPREGLPKQSPPPAPAAASTMQTRRNTDANSPDSHGCGGRSLQQGHCDSPRGLGNGSAEA